MSTCCIIALSKRQDEKPEWIVGSADPCTTFMTYQKQASEYCDAEQSLPTYIKSNKDDIIVHIMEDNVPNSSLFIRMESYKHTEPQATLITTHIGLFTRLELPSTICVSCMEKRNQWNKKKSDMKDGCVKWTDIIPYTVQMCDTCLVSKGFRKCSDCGILIANINHECRWKDDVKTDHRYYISNTSSHTTYTFSDLHRVALRLGVPTHSLQRAIKDGRTIKGWKATSKLVTSLNENEKIDADLDKEQGYHYIRPVRRTR
jgi:hypothetical protein